MSPPHGRHCPCTACAQEDWARPDLAPCGLHGESCPNTYAPYAYDSDKWWPEGLPEWIETKTSDPLFAALDKGLRSFGWPGYNVPLPLPRENSWASLALALAQRIRELEAL